MVSTEHPSVEMLQARQTKLREGILAAGASIRQLVLKDLLRFAEREARWRWLEHMDYAESMPEDTLASMRRALSQTAVEIGEQIGRELANDAVWLAPSEIPPSPRERKSLAGNDALARVFKGIGEKLSVVFAQFLVPADPTGSEAVPYRLDYHTPTYFLDGVYGPSLVEAYWAQMAEFVEIGAAIEANSADARRQKLARRWTAHKG